ncbi:MAG: tRNA (adenosine(37)-N6)-threonylcarbamoyltransferase complex ATPase subunit type 1 TsaE [Pseudolabrys sp.]|nr:tRNA (adenosine(37)-N6)-threonylcarbamoyltransferase complex ATPase subunit type 1 TsaE [Pseudolabrys sp.]
MFPTTSGASSFTVALADEAATLRLMREVAANLQPGDMLTLSGDLGAGKTTFARAMIRHLANDSTIEVPSPTFTLLQTYELPPFPVAHADLYRLTSPAELAELGFDDFPENMVVMLEWPDRAAGFLPEDRLDLAFTLSPQHGPTFRNARLSGYGTMAARVERMGEIRQFLEASGFGDAERARMAGDASTRMYEKLTLENGGTALLMNSPRRPDGPPVRNGKPYSAIAHLAEDVTPFVAMAHGLRQHGFSAPQIISADRDKGLLIVEDLGAEAIVHGTPPVPLETRYEAAVDVLVALHQHDLPETLPVERGVDYTLPRYDLDAFLIEAELLLDWYLPKLNATVTRERRESYLSLWRDALRPAIDDLPTWVMRDYHSPNLLWLVERAGVARVGLLDFQDAVMGPAAYDLASLLQDARVDVPEMIEISLLSRYTRGRLKADPAFDAPSFARIYATLAAQRASKILGIFARLEQRDGKPQYLRHIPRVWTYLQRSLAHPALAPLNAWFRVNVPALKR